MKDKPHGKSAAANDPSAAQLPRSVKPIDSALQDLLKQYKARHELSNNALGMRLNSSGTYVSRYLSGEFSGDVQEFERSVRELLDSEFSARVNNELLATSGFMTESMAEFLTNVRNSRSIGVAWSAPGRGKTKGIEVYRRANSLCIVVTATKHLSGWRRLRDAVLAAIPNKKRIKGESWDEWLERNFTGSGMLLIIDNAHLLTAGARHWLAYDWHDMTRCPVALVGNEEIVTDWKRNGQHRSRVGVAYEVSPKHGAEHNAREMLKLHLPAGAKDTEAVQLAKQLVKGDGALRLLEKHLFIACDLIKAAPEAYTPASAIQAANGLLLTDVKLAA